MSTLEVSEHTSVQTLRRPRKSDAAGMEAALLQQVTKAIARVQERTAPVWPLADYVAVNPYKGLADRKFLTARQALKTVSACELLMPAEFYADAYRQNRLAKESITQAVDEMVADRIPGSEQLDVNQIIHDLNTRTNEALAHSNHTQSEASNTQVLFSLSEILDRQRNTNWSKTVLDEVSKHCSAHFDEGQAAWASPWQKLPLFQAWQVAARHDLTFDILGIKSLRKLVKSLPNNPTAALLSLLERLGVPESLWEEFLASQALAMPGWSAWATYQDQQANDNEDVNQTLTGLLVMRLTYETALLEHFGLTIDWFDLQHRHNTALANQQPSLATLIQVALLRASEIELRKEILSVCCSTTQPPADLKGQNTRLAQMVFCIDVRSERIRRQLETVNENIETFGFAGFFGVPMELVSFGETQGVAQVPALLRPSFKVHETLDVGSEAETHNSLKRRIATRLLRKSWKEFQSTAAGCFSFVESAGIGYGLGMMARTLGRWCSPSAKHDAISAAHRSQLRPCLDHSPQQALAATAQVDLAESILRGIGLIDEFAPLVVLCGHASQCDNNPLQSGLDCGACGGHSGEPNARFATQLLNQDSVRQTLSDRGISIPDSTVFVAGLHNTTTDELNLFDLDLVPDTHQQMIETLQASSKQATRRTRSERLSRFSGHQESDLIRRSQDWSETRPEWGLAGNAAFVAAPRCVTQHASLDGRSFLHSYDYRKDTGFKVLEQILTAPLVVAHWINMQYYASTVDPQHFGSGDKTVHNVVGRFGILSGNGGDLMTGLAWQSVHDGTSYQHQPVRLLAVIAAPRTAISEILSRHSHVEDLLKNGWLQMIALEDANAYRYTEQQSWTPLS